MAEDEIDDGELEDLDVDEIEEPDLEADDEEEDAEFVADGELAVDDDAVVPVVAEEGEEEVAAAPKARKKRDEEEDDEDEADPDDVEADLDKILKERIAANDDDDEDEELEEAQPRTVGETADGVLPKKAGEFMCPGCFLLVNAAQFGPPGQLECPVGESVCPSLKIVEKQYQKARK